MGFDFPNLLGRWQRKPVQSTADAVESIRSLHAEVAAENVDPQSASHALALIRKDLAHFKLQHADIASLDNHPGWIRLKEYLDREIVGKLDNWRVMLHRDVDALKHAEIWADAAERIMSVQAIESKAFQDASALLNKSDAELVAHVAGDVTNNEVEE